MHDPIRGEPDDAAHPAYRQPPVGFHVRRPEDTDLPAIAALYDRAAVRSRHGTIGAGALRTEDELERTWAARRTDALVVLAGERDAADAVVGYLEFHEDVDPWTPALDLYAEGRVDPGTDTGRIGEFLLARARDRAARAAAAHPGLPTSLRTTVVDPSDETLAWFARRGMTPERHLLRLRTDLRSGTPAPDPPAGIRLVDATEPPLEAVHAALVDSFADHHLGATDALDEWRAVALHTGRVDLDQSLIAVDDAGVVVGLSLGRLAGEQEPGLGVVADLGVRPTHRGRGLATALLRASFRRFAEHGAVRAGLEVDDVTLDGALRLYERAGMEVVHHVIVLTTGPLGDG